MDANNAQNSTRDVAVSKQLDLIFGAGPCEL